MGDILKGQFGALGQPDDDGVDPKQIIKDAIERLRAANKSYGESLSASPFDLHFIDVKRIENTLEKYELDKEEIFAECGYSDEQFSLDRAVWCYVAATKNYDLARLYKGEEFAQLYLREFLLSTVLAAVEMLENAGDNDTVDELLTALGTPINVITAEWSFLRDKVVPMLGKKPPPSPFDDGQRPS